MFQIKICGITSIDDARMAARAGADAIGLNFYRESPRHVDPGLAGRIVAASPREVAKAGVFVNSPSEEVCRLFDQLGLDLIQLHGDEPPEYLAALGRRPVVRAFRLGMDGLVPLWDYLGHCRQLGCFLQAVLVDARVPGQYGGTGKTVDWQSLSSYRPDEQASHIPSLVLAGGLHPENVEQAIHAAHPSAVDTASGVESSPGRKDARAVAEFVRRAREAFGSDA